MVKLLGLWAALLSIFLLVWVIREEQLVLRGKIPLGRLRRLWLKAERRRAPRYRVNWSVRYQRLDPPARDGVARTRDLSQTGAGLTVREKLPIGSVLRLEFCPPEQTRSLEVTAQVVWLKEVSRPESMEGRRFFIGIRFHDLDRQIEQQITRALRGHASF